MSTKLSIELPGAIVEALRELIRPIVSEAMEEIAGRDPGRKSSIAKPASENLSNTKPRQPPARKAAMEGVLNIHEVSARTGHTPDRIRHLRVKGHELYSLGWKNGDTQNSRLLFDEHAVDDWVERQRQRSIRPEARRCV